MIENNIFAALKTLHNQALRESGYDLTNAEEVDELVSFADEDKEAPVVDAVVDPEAESEEELQDSYVGKVVIQCNCCNSLVYKNSDEIKLNADETKVNEDEECPVCGNAQGFVIIGQVEPYKAPDTVTVEVEPIEEEPVEEAEPEVEESLHENLNEGDESSRAIAKFKNFVKNYNGEGFGESLTEDDEAEEPAEEEHIDEVEEPASEEAKEDALEQIIEIAKEVLEPEHEEEVEESELHEESNMDKLRRLAKSRVAEESLVKESFGDVEYICKSEVDQNDDAFFTDIDEAIEYAMSHAGIDYVIESQLDGEEAVVWDREEINECLKEDFAADVVVDEPSHVHISAEASEPSADEEMIAPLGDDMAEDILDEPVEEMPEEEEAAAAEESEEEESFDDFEEEAPAEDGEVDEFDEESFDDFAESYLRNRYAKGFVNYKTTSVGSFGDHLIIEGLVTRSNGQKLKKKFILEQKGIDANGRTVFDSENLELRARVEDKKFITESLRRK